MPIICFAASHVSHVDTKYPVGKRQKARSTKAFVPDVTHSAPNTRLTVFVKQMHQAGVTVCVSFMRVSARCASLLTAYVFREDPANKDLVKPLVTELAPPDVENVLICCNRELNEKNISFISLSSRKAP